MKGAEITSACRSRQDTYQDAKTASPPDLLILRHQGVMHVADIEAHKPAGRRTLKPLASLFPYLKRYRGLVAAALFALVLSSATTLALPLAVRRIIDHGFEATDGAMINNYFAMLLAIAIILALASAMRYYYVMIIGERVVTDLRRDVFAHLTSLSQAFFDTNHSGELTSRLTADTVQIRSAFGSSASVALRNTLLCLGAVAMMVYTSPKLAGLALLAIPFIVFPLIAFGRSVRSRSRTTQDTLAASSAFASETISASRTIQSFNAEMLANSRYDAAVEKAYHGARAAISARAILTAVAISLVFGSVVAILWYGAHSVLTGAISAGTLSQFVLYSVIAASSLGQLSEVWGELSQAGGAAERLSELLEEKSPVEEPVAPVLLPVPPRGEASFEHVAFHYPKGAGKPIIADLSFHVAAGETVAIVGPSGAGKSTVFSLLMRFYDPQSGRITIDGTDIRSVTLKELRSRLAIVPQDVAIFASSIHDNIAFGRPDATRDQVRAAAVAAQADGFIARLPEGYDTVAGERGVTLSGGQRQRIAIARAILRDAPILLLDEATSALDAESETLVQKALDELIAKRTTIVIAHRLATVLKADRILVMDEGRIIEEGTHQSLIRQGGLYAKLARLQFNTDANDAA